EGWDSVRAEELHLKNYIYFGMAFSFAVELLNMTMLKRQKRKPVQLRAPQLDEEGPVSDAAK
ncbi:MAG TPA: TerC family protein, partial [Flavisolibacter sp.]|nr:TerC family protein [Flavisolibacter sp.]